MVKEALWTDNGLLLEGGKAFLYTLDRYRYAETIEQRGSSVFDNFCRMICALQDATSEYVNGKDSIEDGLAYTFDLYHMELPTELILPHLFFLEAN